MRALLSTPTILSAITVANTLRRRTIFYNPSTLEEETSDIPKAIALLREYAETHDYELMTQADFLKEVFLKRHPIKGSIIMPLMVIGQNLPFDISRITPKGYTNRLRLYG
jgi:hypothetical protein